MSGGNNKSWSSLPRSGNSGRLYREGSRGSLDEALNYVDAEIISVTLESQDIIGLGFNICGNYGDGIRVSEVNNRGPAKESGEIKVGDRILSVTISYQNIVYEDALTILSYASPYPVKIVLEKVTDDNVRSFVDEKKTGSHTQRIAHPLYRSRSLDALKSVTHTKTSAHPKRAVSDLKLETVKHFLNWRGKSSKKRHMIPNKDRASLSKHSKPRNGHSTPEGNFTTRDREVLSNATSEKASQDSKLKDSLVTNTYQNKNIGHLKAGFTTHETVAEVSPSCVNSAEEYIYQKLSPNKPERNKRRQSDTQHSSPTLPLENDQFTPPNPSFAYPIFSVTDDEIDVDEIDVDELLPEVSATGPSDDELYRKQEQKSGESIRNFATTSELVNGNDFVDYSQLKSPPSLTDAQLEGITIDSSNEPKTALSSPARDFPFIMQDLSNNNSKTAGEVQNPPVLDKETLNKIISMNAFAPGTQGWAGIIATGHQGGTEDDFLPNHQQFTSGPVQKSNDDGLSPETSVPKPSNRELPVTSEELLHKNRNTAYEIRDDFITGNPFAVEINKNKPMIRTGSMQLQPTIQHPNGSDIDDSSPAILPASKSFTNTQAISHGSNSSTNSTGNTNDGSENSDTLEWSGARLVRSESFLNIFIND